MTAVLTKLPERWANRRMLEWARTEVGLNINQVAGIAHLPEGKLRAWESGQEKPSLHDLQTLGEIYDCPVGYFFLDAPPSEQLVRLDYRGLAVDKVALLSYETRLRLRQFSRLVDYATQLTKTLGLDWKVSIPIVSRDAPLEETIRSVCASLGITPKRRSTWESALQAFESWRSAIEDQGILVISLKLNPHEVRGASVWELNRVPAILVNHSDIEASTGRTFTLLHEYAHLVTKQSGSVCDFRKHQRQQPVEHFANRFAAEAIVPRKSFIQLLEDKRLNMFRHWWGDPTLDELRTQFRASRDTVAILLEELSLAPPGFYTSKREMWDKRKPFGFGGKGGRPTRVQQRLREMGKNLSRILSMAHDREAISKFELTEVLNLRLEHAESFVDLAKKL